MRPSISPSSGVKKRDEPKENPALANAPAHSPLLSSVGLFFFKPCHLPLGKKMWRWTSLIVICRLWPLPRKNDSQQLYPRSCMDSFIGKRLNLEGFLAFDSSDLIPFIQPVGQTEVWFDNSVDETDQLSRNERVRRLWPSARISLRNSSPTGSSRIHDRNSATRQICHLVTFHCFQSPETESSEDRHVRSQKRIDQTSFPATIFTSKPSFWIFIAFCRHQRSVKSDDPRHRVFLAVESLAGHLRILVHLRSRYFIPVSYYWAAMVGKLSKSQKKKQRVRYYCTETL